MRTVYKYSLTLGYDNYLLLNKSAKFLKFADQNGQVQAWFEIDLNIYETAGRSFRIFATGENIDDRRYDHLDTALSGSFVWHLYEVKENL